MPFILRIHTLNQRVKGIHAKFNVAKLIREKNHIRDPSVIDYHLNKGYERYFEAESHNTYTPYLYQFLLPNVKIKLKLCCLSP